MSLGYMLILVFEFVFVYITNILHLGSQPLNWRASLVKCILVYLDQLIFLYTLQLKSTQNNAK